MDFNAVSGLFNSTNGALLTLTTVSTDPGISSDSEIIDSDDVYSVADVVCSGDKCMTSGTDGNSGVLSSLV
uniref:Uncharacterized protein n=1 Tax=Anguilla anguilla TaxID=7936 RepID=A0A0E9S8T1_ANGAN